jgi:hypothetical protein
MTTDLRVLAFSFDGEYTENAVYQKLLHLGILKEEDKKLPPSSSSQIQIVLPEELPSIENTLKILNSAVESLKNPELDKTDFLIVQEIISECKDH